MRGLRILVLLCLLLPGAAAASEELVPVLLSVEDLASGQPILRFWPMPQGAAAVESATIDAPADPLRATEPQALSAPAEVRTLAPAIMRGRRLLPLLISPPAGASPGEWSLRVTWSAGKSALGANAVAAAASRGFHDALRPLLLGSEKSAATGAREGTYLIITAPEFLEAVQPLAQWKREKGLDVQLVTTNETGRDRNQIRAYIGDLYRNAPNPPQFVLLVGDIEWVQAYDFHGVVSDLPFVLQDGDDFFPDLEIGRLSVRDLSQAQTVVAKVLRHEKDPYRGDAGNGAWMGRGLVVGADYASTTPREVSRFIRRSLLGLGWSQVDSVYFPPHHGSGTPLISARLNAGVSLVTYRGWAYGPQGWDRPTYLNNHIAGLNNDWMLPVVMSFVCLNGKFDEPECFGEAWLRAGTADAPKGGIAFIGNGEHWSHTRFNDAAAIGAVAAMQQGGLRRLGEILDAVKLNFLRQFPLEIPYESEAGESVEFYYHIYNLLGDPDMSLWLGPPRAITVAGTSELVVGANLCDLMVKSTDTQEAIEGVRVALSRGGTLLGCAWTDAAGSVSIPFAELAGNDPVRVAVTGANVQPVIYDLPVVDRARLALAGVSQRDDGTDGSSGNGDGVVNAGETIALRLTLRNASGPSQSDLTARVVPVADPETPLPPGAVPIPALAQGESQTLGQPFLYAVPAASEDGFAPHFRLRIERSGSLAQEIDLALAVGGPTLRHTAHAFEPALKPGAASTLRVTLANEGSTAADGVTAILRSLEPEWLAVTDSTDAFGLLAPGASADGAEGFAVHAPADAPPGAAVNLQLLLATPEGYRAEASFAVTIGAADHTRPLGPDGHGYWAYDNTDTDYPAGAPLYRWQEISPTYGGAGTPLVLDSNPDDFVDPNGTEQVALPFTFSYYGQSYRSILVSDNGWISFDLRKAYDFYNWIIPGPYGNLARVCPFWDNLMPGKRDTVGLVGDGVYTWYDEAGHRFIVEWSRIGNTDQPGTPPNPSLFFDDLQTFQVILHDPAFTATPSGDGVIDFQYKQIVNIDRGRMYATVGIENETGADGLQYTFSNLYPPEAAPLNSGLAIRLTTTPPEYVPFRLSRAQAERAADGIALSWAPCDERPRGRYHIYRVAERGEYRLLEGPELDGSARSFLDRTADPRRRWSYVIGSDDPVGRETRSEAIPYTTAAAGPAGILSLAAVGANPSREGVELVWSLPQPGEARLTVHDVGGRLVRALVRGAQKSGSGAAVWDGRDDRGLRLPAGTYWARLEAAGERRVARVTLVH